MPPPEPCSRLFCSPLGRPGPGPARTSRTPTSRKRPRCPATPACPSKTTGAGPAAAPPVKRPRRPGRHRHGQRDQHPLPAGEPGPREDRQHHGQIGERHEEHQRHRQPPAQPPHRGLSAAAPASGPAGRRPRRFAGRLYHADQSDMNTGRGRYVGPFGRKVDGGGDAVSLFSRACTRAAQTAQVMPPTTSSTWVGWGRWAQIARAGNGTRRYGTGHGVPGLVTVASIVTVPERRKISVSGTVARDSYGAGCWSTKSSPSGVSVRVPCAGMTRVPTCAGQARQARSAGSARRGGRRGCARRRARRECR